jgi:hypothetical protein
MGQAAGHGGGQYSRLQAQFPLSADMTFLVMNGRVVHKVFSRTARPEPSY